MFICIFQLVALFICFLISCFVYSICQSVALFICFFYISCFDCLELFVKSFAFINQLFSIIQLAGRGCFIQFTNLTLFEPTVNLYQFDIDWLSKFTKYFNVCISFRNKCWKKKHWLTDQGNVQYFSLFALHSLWSISPLQFLQNGNWSLRTWPFYIRWNICQFLNYKLWPSKDVNLPTFS